MTLNLDGSGISYIETGIGFFDHMLEGFSKPGFFDLHMECDGDLQVDSHHTIEDCGIVLGDAIKKALGDKSGIKRFGSCIHMAEAMFKAFARALDEAVSHDPRVKGILSTKGSL